MKFSTQSNPTHQVVPQVQSFYYGKITVIDGFSFEVRPNNETNLEITSLRVSPNVSSDIFKCQHQE